MKQSKAKEWFELWWTTHGDNQNKDLAWNAFKAGVKIAELYAEDET